MQRFLAELTFERRPWHILHKQKVAHDYEHNEYVFFVCHPAQMLFDRIHKRTWPQNEQHGAAAAKTASGKNVQRKKTS